jgi:hypothetical protein
VNAGVWHSIRKAKCASLQTLSSGTFQGIPGILVAVVHRGEFDACSLLCLISRQARMFKIGRPIPNVKPPDGWWRREGSEGESGPSYFLRLRVKNAGDCRSQPIPALGFLAQMFASGRG